jgi:hypothetical protein
MLPITLLIIAANPDRFEGAHRAGYFAKKYSRCIENLWDVEQNLPIQVVSKIK